MEEQKKESWFVWFSLRSILWMVVCFLVSIILAIVNETAVYDNTSYDTLAPESKYFSMIGIFFFIYNFVFRLLLWKDRK